METNQRLKQYINDEETERCTDNALLKATYKGPNATIKDKKGECYFSNADDVWYFRTVSPQGEWYRVRDLNNLHFPS